MNYTTLHLFEMHLRARYTKKNAILNRRLYPPYAGEFGIHKAKDYYSRVWQKCDKLEYRLDKEITRRLEVIQDTEQGLIDQGFNPIIIAQYL